MSSPAHSVKEGRGVTYPDLTHRTLAEVWNLTAQQVAAEYERLKRFPNAALPRTK